jgi:hypothetical protein
VDLDTWAQGLVQAFLSRAIHDLRDAKTWACWLFPMKERRGDPRLVGDLYLFVAFCFGHGTIHP